MPNTYKIRENFAGWLRRLANRISPVLPPPPVVNGVGTFYVLRTAFSVPSGREPRNMKPVQEKLLSMIYVELEKTDYVRFNRRDDVHPSIIVYEASLLVAKPPQE